VRALARQRSDAARARHRKQHSALTSPTRPGISPSKKADGNPEVRNPRTGVPTSSPGFLVEGPPPGLPGGADSAYRPGFNEHRPEDVVRPQPPSPAGDGG